MKIALAQINPTVGDVQGNLKKIKAYLQQAETQHVDVVVFPELCLTGYPPKDLLLKRSFLDVNTDSLQQLAEFTSSYRTAIIIGFVDVQQGRSYNAAAVLGGGKIIRVYHKVHLPNYDVFDEKRYFTPGDPHDSEKIFPLAGRKVGLSICEDIWIDDGPHRQQAKLGADIIINISASPFHAGKRTVREDLLSRRARQLQKPIIYLNIVGAQDDLIFDGRSYVFNQIGQKVAQAAAFREELLVIDVPEMNTPNNNHYASMAASAPEYEKDDILDDVYNALVLGVRDYFQKNRFTKAVLGLSGGIDSALTAAIAVEALGADNVIGVTMPSKFSSSGSVDDSYALAKNLGITIHTIPIKETYRSYLATLSPQFAGTAFNVAEENIQARIRGNLLMALSNKFGYLVLATGNKSELSVGYATLYGDMAGGLAVISDVFKVMVYQLCSYINQVNQVKRFGFIPQSIIDKAPSAELRDNQKDSDSLPEYPILDPILRAYVEEEKSKEEIIALGFDPATVERVLRLVDRNEYKRQQAALGLRITPRAFGSGRRIPITNGWRE